MLQVLKGNWMFGYTNRDRIKHKDIRDKVGVTLVEDKMREVRLRKFRDVMRRCVDATVRSLQDIFPDLFALAQHQNKTVVEMWSSQDWKLSFRRLMNDWKIPRLAKLYKHLETFQGYRMDKIACGGLDSTSDCIR
ncbi:hypothetical protein H5410_022053 [Solanum commersonii]|uniref:Reverse transcriptase n=1 Tax=Solanum commersonii TaxID=4109 RepID=A0A9J5ZGZ3_SOLCO|nr:hypothetical protein H5410_022053 [Solanum commersonii]